MLHASLSAGLALDVVYRIPLLVPIIMLPSLLFLFPPGVRICPGTERFPAKKSRKEEARRQNEGHEHMS